jgi:hypothetical protein
VYATWYEGTHIALRVVVGLLITGWIVSQLDIKRSEIGGVGWGRWDGRDAKD